MTRQHSPFPAFLACIMRCIAYTYSDTHAISNHATKAKAARACPFKPFQRPSHMLYAHVGASLHTIDELERFPVPTLDDLRSRVKSPSAGNRWRPVPFATMADEIATGVERAGYVIKKQHFAVSKDGHDLFSCYDLTANIPGRDDMSAVLGWRFSNMQRFALKGVSGARVFICDNGAIVGDFVFGHKMTNGFEREVSIDEGMVKWQRQIELIGRAYDAMQRIELTPEHVSHTLMQAVRARIISPSQLGKIDAEFASERSQQQFGERPTIRRLYEAVTEVGKSWTSPRVVERGLRGFPDMALRLYGDADLAQQLTEGDLGDPSMN